MDATPQELNMQYCEQRRSSPGRAAGFLLSSRGLRFYCRANDLVHNSCSVGVSFIFKENVMAYVDGFVLPLPKANVEAYRQISEKCGEIWREHGALEFRECIGDDVKPGKLTSFPQSVNLEPDELVVFSWIVYESRAKRDEVNEKVMKDPRMADMMSAEAMPFDGKRMIYGGFEMIIDL
jgi:uncharacterized protein YbaA (DUF1428 family)